MVLCVGGVSSGKTFLLQHVTDPANANVDIATQPTVGVNIFQLARKQPGSRKLKQTVDIRELGGELCPLWTTYVKNEENVIFVIDSENVSQVSQIGVKLAECLGQLERNISEMNKLVRLLIVFSKLDRNGGEHITKIKKCLKLKEFRHYSPVNISEIHFNPLTRDGVAEISKWIFNTKYSS